MKVQGGYRDRFVPSLDLGKEVLRQSVFTLAQRAWYRFGRWLSGEHITKGAVLLQMKFTF